MSTECSILNISALRLLAQSVNFCTDFTIHELSSLLYTSQVYFFKYERERFCPLELFSNWHTRTQTHGLPSALRIAWSWGFNKGVGLLVLFLPVGYAMLMRPNMTETAVHGYHCVDDMAMFECAISFPEPTCLLVSSKTRGSVIINFQRQRF